MATQLKGSQLRNQTLTLNHLVTDFLQGRTWSVSSDNSAVINGLALPDGSDNTQAATVEYVKNLVDTSLKSPDGFATTSSGDYPSTYKGRSVEEGDMFYVTDTTNGNTVGSKTVNVGDALVALVDAPGNTDANWIILESNRDQATEDVKGVIEIATQSETDTGTDDTRAVTPLKLATYLTNQGYTTVTAGNGLTETTVGTTKTIDVTSDNAGITVNSDSIALTVGNTNGTSLEITASGVELVTNITGNRTFSPDSGETLTFSPTDVNGVLLTVTPDGTVSNAVANVDYVDSVVSSATQEVFNELPTVTGGSTDVTLANTPTSGTERVYLNGQRMAPGSGNDYTISGNTITFASALSSTDVVLVDYKY